MATSGKDESWMDTIRQKLVDTFVDNVETLTRVLFYLEQEDTAYKDDDRVPPAWKMLKTTLFSDDVFKSYATKLAEDTLKAEKDDNYRKTMGMLYDQMLEADVTPLEEDHDQGFVMARFVNLDITQKSGLMGFARAWAMIPTSSQMQILDIIPRIVTNKTALTTVDEVVGLVNKTGGTVVMVTLAAVHLTIDVITNIARWRRGEISGKRCVKNIMDSFCTITAGLGGGIAGAAVGSLAGPVGTVIGGITCGIASSIGMNVISDRITQKLFGLPKDEALENAYNYLGVKMTASNHEINSAFRQLCLKHHPDKGGSKEEFYILQLNMAVIKDARGELY